MKTKRTFINVLFFVIAFLFIGLIAIDFFIVPVKLPVVWICVAILAALAVLFIILGKNKSRKLSVIYAVFVFLIAAFLVFWAYCFPWWNSLYFSGAYSLTEPYDAVFTTEEAVEDVEELMHYLDRYHPEFIDGRPEKTAEIYESVLSYLNEKETVTAYELQRELSAVCASLNDGHTRVYSNNSANSYLKDYLYKKAEGWTLVAVNGDTYADSFEKYKHLFSCDVEAYGEQSFLNSLLTKSGVLFLGIDINNYSLTWEKEGVQKTGYYAESDFISAGEYREIYSELFGDNTGTAAYEWIYYEIDTENETAILTLNECNYNSELKETYRELFTEVKEKGIKNIIVDLRSNGGGASLVANEFIKYLPVDTYNISGEAQRWGIFITDVLYKPLKKTNRQYTDLLFEGNVYVLTSISTFSSATMFAEYIHDNGLGTVIGEVAGNSPNGCGDINVLQLKNSGLMMSVSTKKFIRSNGDTTEDFLIPNIECESSEALDKALEIIASEKQ